MSKVVVFPVDETWKKDPSFWQRYVYELQVILHIYDLSGGLAKQVVHWYIPKAPTTILCSPSPSLQMSMGFIGKQIDGIWHTGLIYVFLSLSCWMVCLIALVRNCGFWERIFLWRRYTVWYSRHDTVWKTSRSDYARWNTHSARYCLTLLSNALFPSQSLFLQTTADVFKDFLNEISPRFSMSTYK